MTDLIQEVNDLFLPFYPYVARQIAHAYGMQEGQALEVGPYAPGISIQLASLCPELEITVGDDFPGILSYFREQIEAASLAHRIQVREVDKRNLPFGDDTLDLVYFRGALFFWEEQERILKEAYRVLKRGGVAVMGGGFGAEAPDALINSHLPRSRELNRRLQKKVLSLEELEAILSRASLAPHAFIDHRHGLWVVLRKPPTPR